MMKCRKHIYELGPGVCASCLRDRLLSLLAAQTGSLPSPDHLHRRSVSPYTSHRRRSFGQHCRFFSTPQVGPTDTSSVFTENESRRRRRRRRSKFSLFSALFGYSRSDVHVTGSSRRSSTATSWISTLIFRNRNRAVKSATRSQSSFVHERGMSPDLDDDRSVCSSGYSTESSSTTGWRRPEPTPVRRFNSSVGPRHASRGVSGFAVCLSPLNLGVVGDPRGSLSGKIGGNKHRRHVSIGAAATLVPSGSRKLTDHGRFR